MRFLTITFCLFLFFSCKTKKTAVSENKNMINETVKRIDCSEEVKLYLTNNQVVSDVGGYVVEGVSKNREEGVYTARLKSNLTINNNLQEVAAYKTHIITVWTDKNCNITMTKK